MAFGCFPAAAGADIYWVAGSAGDRIARAGDDGRRVNTRFITGLAAVGSLAIGGGHLYWTSGTAIGRATLNGRGVIARAFIRGLGAVGGVAVDNRFVYWLSDLDPACGNTPGFGRAELNGGHVERGFICSATHKLLAVDGYASGIGAAAGYLYWGWNAGIGRVPTTGLGKYDNGFVAIPRGDSAAAVTVSNGYIYWGGYKPGPHIGRARLDGMEVNPEFINSESGDVASEVTVTSHYLYFANDYFSGMTIARATLQGVVNWDFISGLGAVGALAVGPGG